MGILKFLLKAVVVLAVIVALGLFAARFADGPLELVAGGPFRSGEVHSGAEPDWAFLRDTDTVQFQLEDPARSRTTWIIEHQGRVFIPSGYMTSWWGRIWKQWPHHVATNDRILLRVGDTIYERRLARVQDGDWVEPVLARLSEKYAGGQPIPRAALDSGYLWVFEVLPR